MYINFILQAFKLLHNGNYSDSEVRMIYDFIRTIDNDVLISYNNSNTLLTYKNDLEFFIKLLDLLLIVLEQSEEYEKCGLIIEKKNKSLDIINNKN